MEQPTGATTITPPRWAEAVLGVLVPREQQESVTGDLLEEYRDSKVPVIGVRAANRWYVAQVAGTAWRLAAFSCVTAAVLHAWREGVDELVPVASYVTRSTILTYGMMAIYISAGFWVGWRIGRVAAGTLIAMLASLIGWSGAWVVAASLALMRVPNRLYPGGVEEMFFLPLMILPVVVVLGTFGAVIGTAARRIIPARTTGY
jgi:hypothetical protein